MTEKNYIGITIGPIFETMNLVSSPSALWASSYIFSYISKSICGKLVIEPYNIPEEKIVTPYYRGRSAAVTRNDGVGLFHDRIIFEKPDGFNIAAIEDIKKQIINDIASEFGINNSTGFLNEYIMISAAEFTAENPILDGSVILDSLELSKSFVASESKNPILDTFTSAKTSNDKTNAENERVLSRNSKIKSIVKDSLKLKGWQLFTDGEDGIKDLGDIARCDANDKKYNDYCAIVRADGDRIGTIIEGLGFENPEMNFSKFSETCFSYCSQAAELVKKYGGVTIYSGGDDLLAILPAQSEKGTLFDFAKELTDTFNTVFKTFIDNCKDCKPSLSVAIYLFFKKFPLYEALSESVSLLFDTAKGTRNCVAFRLRKHSGQSVEIVIPNDSLPDVIGLQNKILQPVKAGKADSNRTDDIIVSALQKIALFDKLFEIAKTDVQVDNLFNNVFDADAHTSNPFLHDSLPEAYNKLRNKKKPIFISNKKDTFPNAFSAVMRIIKFYLEK